MTNTRKTIAELTDNPGLTCILEVLSFLAAPGEQQINSIGTSPWSWFSPDAPCFDAHDPWILGLYMVWLDCRKTLDDIGVDSDENHACKELTSLLDLMFWTAIKGTSNNWTRPSLQGSPNWQSVRGLASDILRQANCQPASLPLNIQVHKFAEMPTDPAIADLLSEAGPAELGQPVTSLDEIGQFTKAMMAEVGIHSISQLREVGIVAAYHRISRVNLRATTNLLYLLEMSLTGLRWGEVNPERWRCLMKELEQLEMDQGS